MEMDLVWICCLIMMSVDEQNAERRNFLTRISGERWIAAQSILSEANYDLFGAKSVTLMINKINYSKFGLKNEKQLSQVLGRFDILSDRSISK